MTEYNKFAEGYFTSTAATAQLINLPFIPNTFEIWNKTQWGSDNATPQIEYAIGFAEDPAGTAYVTENVTSSAALENVLLTSGGFSFISAGTYMYGPTLTISSVSKANPAVVTTSTNHNLSTGNVVWIYGTTGMLQIAGAAYTVTVTAPTTFTIDVNSTGFAAVASAGFCKQLLYSDLYVPQGSIITAISTGTTTTITTAINHKFVVGQEVFFVVPPVQGSATAWGTVQLDSAGVLQQTGIPQQAYVTSIPNPNQIVVNVNSTGFTAFAFPTSAQASLGMTFAQVFAIGDQNSGTTNAVTPLPLVPPAITIPGAFYANTHQGVLIGASLLLNTSDVIRWRATYPDLIKTSAP
jgi:Ubiquitin-activating enzyme E1 FCCH domain